MKDFKRNLITLVLIFSSVLVDAKVQNNHSKKSGKTTARKLEKKKAHTPNAMGANLGTDFKFNDLSVRGQYQSALEGKVTVENEKPVEDLLDYRTSYADRIEIAKGQR